MAQPLYTYILPGTPVVHESHRRRSTERQQTARTHAHASPRHTTHNIHSTQQHSSKHIPSSPVNTSSPPSPSRIPREPTCSPDRSSGSKRSHRVSAAQTHEERPATCPCQAVAGIASPPPGIDGGSPETPTCSSMVVAAGSTSGLGRRRQRSGGADVVGDWCDCRCYFCTRA